MSHLPNSPRRAAVEAAAVNKTHVIERHVLELYIRLVKRANEASDRVSIASTQRPAQYRAALVAQTEAHGALERFLDERGVRR